MLDIIINDILWVPVIFEDILDSFKFILNIALTTNLKSSIEKHLIRFSFLDLGAKECQSRYSPVNSGFL